jgi:hypothetical protein
MGLCWFSFLVVAGYMFFGFAGLAPRVNPTGEQRLQCERWNVQINLIVGINNH